MTLNQLRIFVAIVDAGFNITHAADRVHATQPGLSKQLKQIEEYLGVTLFVRKGKSIQQLTPAGEAILVHARRVQAEVRQIRTVAANIKQSQIGSLRVATVYTQARYVLPPVAAELRRRLPEVSIDIQTGEHDEAIARLARGDVDVAVFSTSGAPPEGVFAVPAYHWYRVAVVPRDHELARIGRPITHADLARYPLISYSSSRLPTSSLLQAFQERGLEPNVAFTARDADVIKAHVRARLGVGLIAGVAVEAIDHEDLAVIDVSALFPRCTTWIALRRHDVVPHFVAEFVSLYAPRITRSLLKELRERPELVDNLSVPVWSSSPLPGSVAIAA